MSNPNKHPTGTRKAIKPIPAPDIHELAINLSLITQPTGFRKDEWDEYRERIKRVLRNALSPSVKRPPLSSASSPR